MEQATQTHQLVRQVVSALTMAEHRGKGNVRETSQVMPELGCKEGAGVSQVMDVEDVGLIRQHVDVQAIERERVVLGES